MASRQARDGAAVEARRRRLVPVDVVVAAYFLAGTIWVVGIAPTAAMITEATSAARWVVDLGLGVMFVAATTLVLSLSMRRRVERIDRADARRHDADDRTRSTTRQLAASEDRNRLQATALSGTTTAVVITDRGGTIEWTNAAFGRMSGYPPSAAVGATLRLVRSGLHEEGFYRDMWDTILAGRTWRGEVVNRRPDGELYTVSETITPVGPEEGRVHHFVATMEDVTERVQAARELETSRRRLESLFDHAIDAIALTDDGGRYIEVNPAYCDLTGYARDELLAMGPHELAAAGPASGVSGRPDGPPGTGTESGLFALLHKDGQVVETEYRAVSDIQPGVHLSVLRDITARNHLLHALTTAEAEFRELAESAADIVAKLRIENGRMRIEYVNPAATTILGYSTERFYEDLDLLATLFQGRGDDLDDAVEGLPTAADPNRLATIQVQRADGRPVWLEVYSSFIEDPSNTWITLQLVARDVTARFEMMQALEQALADQLAAAEQLRALNAMKETFLQNVSHELRTPLTSILGFAHLLSEPRHGLSPGDTREFHRRIFSNAERLQRLLDDLLDIDHLRHGLVTASRTPTDLVGLIQRVVDATELGGRVVELDLEPLTMELDAPRIQRLVANLLGNVVRHAPPDTRVRIRTRTTPDGVELTVDDDGPGIPLAMRELIVEPFQQGAAAAASAQPGTGLGLALVDGFAQLHGGSLTVSEAPGGGARMAVTLAHPRAVTSPDPGTDGASGTTEEAERITNEALRQLLQATGVDQVRGILISVVHRLGGWTVPARLADSDALPIDLSFGIDDPLLPTAEPSGRARASLERHLPRLVEDARRAIESLARTERFAHEASVDPLTGLLNRRAYERALTRLRAGDVVVLFDLDGFKSVNDSRGHKAGDEVLRSFGATLRSITRVWDHPCRIGGDEFALLLGSASAPHVDELIGRFRTRWEERRPAPVGFSAGVAIVEDDPAAAATAADQAMYVTKRAHRGEASDAAPASRGSRGPGDDEAARQPSAGRAAGDGAGAASKA